ncbi:YkvA family protein [Phormidium yuhuli AB48]|uniref:YkvA family protein n=1 Tax=Phormidium yuhuli AB48 TaxID=2940671 RepID=A0ABY5AU39_9CYAN|nr:YkvA family protein [Phormidium yuhuli]USR92745.1 YkvA family protein [Phormidium yuhuli AB48]
MNPVFRNLATWYRAILRNPKYRGWVILGTLLYLISPLDISPDVLPILGQVDDVAILVLLMSEVWQMVQERFSISEEMSGQTAATVQSAEEEETVDVDAVSVE